MHSDETFMEENFQAYNFSFILNQSHIPFAILRGKDLLYVFANASYVALANGRELLGHTFASVSAQLHNQIGTILLKKVLNTGEPLIMPGIPVTVSSGVNAIPAIRYYEWTFSCYKDINGHTEGILASGYDVTEQVRENKKEERKFLNFQAYNLFMQAPVGFSLVVGDEYVIELANASGLKSVGLGEEVIGRKLIEIFPNIKEQGFLDVLDSVRRTGKTIELKERSVVLNIDGQEKVIYLNIIYLPYYRDDKIVGVLSVSSDVTEQVLARKNLAEAGEKFETMANSIPNLAWIADATGSIYWYNARWYEYTGTTLKEMTGWGWTSVHDPKKLEDVLKLWKASIESGVPFEMVFPIRGADEVLRPFLTRVVPIHNAEGNIIQWMGTNTDITKQVEAQQMKDAFLSMASHELKTPITTIKAYSQIIEASLEKTGEEKTLLMVRKMSGQVDKLTLLVNSLLDVTRIHKGQLVLNYKEYDFKELFQKVISDMQKICPTHKIESNECTSIPMLGDRDKIAQVLNNLISNAIKYSPNSKSIYLETTDEEDGVQLSVRDTGIGISEEQHSKVFQQFYRVLGSNHATFPGMGIGLYICSDIVKKHGGKIWLTSKVGEGSVFYIWLPHRSIASS